jgi:D-alanyl-D-alanine carboxypeptidase (penicillin-binding protein 5/6)
LVYQGPVRAPIKAGQQIGVVKVWRGDDIAVEQPVYASQSVPTGSTIHRALDGMGELLIGTLRAGFEKL